MLTILAPSSASTRREEPHREHRQAFSAGDTDTAALHLILSIMVLLSVEIGEQTSESSLNQSDVPPARSRRRHDRGSNTPRQSRDAKLASAFCDLEPVIRDLARAAKIAERLFIEDPDEERR